MPRPMRIAFFGTPDFAVPTLTEIIGQGHEVAAVYTQPPRAAGRGMAERKSPVHEVAERFGLPVFTPDAPRTEGEAERFAALGVDVGVVAAYGQILPQGLPRRAGPMAASTCTARCCRAGAAPRRSPAPSWPATPRPASWSCAWRRGSIPARSP